MTVLKPTFLIPTALVIGCLGWWLTPHYDAEDENYYISVLCAVPQQNEQQLQHDMKNVIEGSNSDYALQKIHFVPGLASRVINNWKSLTPGQQQHAANDTHACSQLLMANKQ